MVPPLVTASRCAPGRPESVPATRSQTTPRPQLGELVAGVAPGEHVEHRLERRLRQGGERRGPADQRGEVLDGPVLHRHHRDDLLGEHVERVAREAPSPRSPRRASARRRRRPAPGRRGTSGRSRPRLTAPTWWPARPTRCSPLATAGGDSTWTTRSTAPMSMPSSRLEVATTAGSRPALSASSISARCSLLTEPWWARASGGRVPPRTAALSRPAPSPRRAGAPRSAASAVGPASISLSREHSRSAVRREFANTIVERCVVTSSTTRSSRAGQIEARRSAPAALPPSAPSPPGPPPVGSPSIAMSSTGTTTLTSIVFCAGGWTTSTSRVPPRNRATSSTGRTVADSPIRRAGRGSRASRRSRLRARWAPRLVAATACTSSRITVSTPRRLSRARAGEQQEQRLRGRDEDVRRASGEGAPLLRGGVARSAPPR